MTYRTRGYLPHLEIRGSTYFITLRLADTLPQNVLCEIMEEIQSLRAVSILNSSQKQRFGYLKSKKVQDYLDQGIGECFLKNPEVAAIIREAVEHHDGIRYTSHVCCIMPNHVHWILTPLRVKGMNTSDSRIIPIMQKLKSFTAHSANKILNRSGAFWNREYYDHVIRSEEEFGRLILYTIENPVKAKLCSHWTEWPWTFYSRAVREALQIL